MKVTNLRICVLLVFCLGLWLFPTGAWAHTDDSVGFSKITADAGARLMHYELYIEYFTLSHVVDLEVQPNAGDREMSAKLETNRQLVNDYINRNMEVSIDGIRVAGHVVQTNVEQKLNRMYAHIFLDYPMEKNSQALHISYHMFFDDIDPSHRNIVIYDWGGEQGQFVFQNSAREFLSGKTSFLIQIERFINLGFHHIMIGYDHILFVMALVLGSRKIKDVLKVATVFTLAHSVTLCLSSFHVISVSPAIIEPLIALSIAYAALESFFGPNSKVRLLVVFIFGLIHGIGFADALELTGKMTLDALLSLASFNIGVECGQALIIVLLFPLLAYVRRFRWSGLLKGTITVGILGFGLIWYFQRMFT
ncbi:HupE/UreJ family protein [Paenibacillus piri]|uniref:HupE/UreJ family protein n=1 Tax=Paenibacillus piri TaxID=2547395 RepID=A0A4R5KS36_9BACL|nr:HupE/UreJ family protein [Paenibacillus piri]TDF98653.1 HupE/UreJ family protein [Paenibacillus piri]